LPPTQSEIPSFNGSAIGIAGHTVKQLAQNMHSSSITSIYLLPSTVAGRMAAVGQDAETFGISHIFATFV
jgi:hypothetical protein